jgi:hypothetical protein
VCLACSSYIQYTAYSYYFRRLIGYQTGSARSSKRRKKGREKKWRNYIFSWSSTDARSRGRTLFEILPLLWEVTCGIIYLCVIRVVKVRRGMFKF